MTQIDFNPQQNRNILASELEQRRAVVTHMLFEMGEQRVDQLNELLDAMEHSESDTLCAVGRLAQVGFLHWCHESNELNC